MVAALYGMRREGIEPPSATRTTGLRPGAYHSATYALRGSDALVTRRMRKSAWKDLNLHPRAPEARAAAKLSYRLMCQLAGQSPR